ncbi:enoyl-CoA hydratase/isomerase family protein [Streptomyces sp. NPDC085946]|uniref:enoyl-CoA hydratase/isomerase family protein n=1 Tax=Streptomyces sp. NPDC085946 TaxID=3365744 RepID=UPI0037D21C6E
MEVALHSGRHGVALPRDRHRPSGTAADRAGPRRGGCGGPAGTGPGRVRRPPDRKPRGAAPLGGVRRPVGHRPAHRRRGRPAPRRVRRPRSGTPDGARAPTAGQTADGVPRLLGPPGRCGLPCLAGRGPAPHAASRAGTGTAPARRRLAERRTGPPRARNAFDAATRDALCEALEVASADPSITRVDLRGTEPAFCSGGDLTEFGTARDTAEAHRVRVSHSPAALLLRCASKVTAHLHGAVWSRASSWRRSPDGSRPPRTR